MSAKPDAYASLCICDADRSAPQMRVDLHLPAARKAIGLIGHAHHSHKLTEHLGRHTLLLRRRSVRGNTVSTLVRHADGHVDHLFGQRIERAWPHDFLNTVPGTAESDRIVRQRLPEVI